MELKSVRKRITVALCANAGGSHKLKPLVIRKSARPRCFIQSAECSQLPPQSEGEDDCHCVQAVLEEFDRLMGSRGRHVVLLLDNAPSHRIPAELTNVKVCCDVAR